MPLEKSKEKRRKIRSVSGIGSNAEKPNLTNCDSNQLSALPADPPNLKTSLPSKSSDIPDNLLFLEASLLSQSSAVPDVEESLPSRPSDRISDLEGSRLELFNSLFQSEELLSINFAWRRCNIEEGNLRAIQFSHCTGRMEDGIVKTVMQKKIVLCQVMSI